MGQLQGSSDSERVPGTALVSCGAVRPGSPGVTVCRCCYAAFVQGEVVQDESVGVHGLPVMHA